MIHDLLTDTLVPAAAADVCIIGAGAAGISLAVELANRGRRVLLLEGGGATLDDDSQEPYRSHIHGLHHRGIHGGRFRAHGGTTNKWGGQILELDGLDFAPRPWIEASGWPISKSELTRFYARALELEGLRDVLRHDTDVWATLGEPRPDLPGMTSYLSRWCPEPNFARLHRAALEGPAIAVWLHANATGLIFDNERAIGVNASTQTGTRANFHASAFVFCLGAIESSRFFLQPRDGALQWNTSGLLGRHFQDHIDCNAAILKPRSPSELHRAFDSIFINGLKYQPKIKLMPQRTQDEELLNTAASLAFESPDAEALANTRTAAKHLLRGRFGEVRSSDLISALRHLPDFLRQTVRYTVQHRSFQPRNALISLRVHCEQEPCSKSAITLSDERDSLGMLRTRLSWRISPLELRSIRSFIAHARAAFAGFAQVQPAPDIEDDSALIARCEDSFHHMGGMRMHASPSLGVVTPELRLHGTRNVFVCSSAVFPTSGFSNPTHTLLALAVRLAEHLTS